MLLMITPLFSQGIKFQHGSFDQSLKIAKKEKKMIFMDCFTEWCGPCKSLSKNVFPQKETGDFFNSRFVSVKMDMEKGEGIDLMEKYGVNAFPTLLFLDGDGNLLHKVVGSTDVQGLISVAKDALTPEGRLPYYEEQYNKGKRDADFIVSYMHKLSDGSESDKLKDVGNTYLKNTPESKLLNYSSVVVICYVGTSYQSNIFKFMVKNRMELAKIEGIDQKDVDDVIKKAVRGHLNEVADAKSWTEIQAEIVRCENEFDYVKFFNLEKGLRKRFYMTSKQYDKWYEMQVKGFDKQAVKNPERTFNRCYQIFSNMLRNDAFNESTDLFIQSINRMEDLKAKKAGMPYVYNILASLYQRVGNKEKALEAVNSYIKLQKKNGEKVLTNTLQTKKEIENM